MERDLQDKRDETALLPCSVLQFVAVRCSLLQFVAVYCRALLREETCKKRAMSLLRYAVVCCSVLQCITLYVCCSVLHYAVVCCSVLQRITVYYTLYIVQCVEGLLCGKNLQDKACCGVLPQYRCSLPHFS